jgi:hypothetical protein
MTRQILSSRLETIEFFEENELPEHLLPLPGNEWALWRCAVLRGAGFPSTDVLKMTAPESAYAADQLIAAEHEARQLQQKAIEALRRRLNAAETDKILKSALSKAIKKLVRNDLPPAPALACSDDSLAAYDSARRRVDLARSAYDEAFKSGLAALSSKINNVAGDNRFRAAVTWQNRDALHRAIDALLRMPEHVRHAERRGCEELVAKYVQRYAVKNDTIGFFGPVGWARLDEAEESMRVETGPEFVAKRTVYFESWCMQALIATLNNDHSLRPWMSPRRIPPVHLEGLTLHHPLGTRQISADQMIVLRLCNGSRTARELAQHLMRFHSSRFRSEAQVFGTLQSLTTSGVINWGFEVPYELYPERTLRRQLEKIDNESLRESALSLLDQLESARDRISHAAGDSEKLDEAFVNFETTFTRLTNHAPTRGAGKVYAARTLVYEDCRRDTDVVLGEQLLKSLTPPLTLLLSSCRWLTWEVARSYRSRFKQLYAQLVARSKRKQVDLLSFWLHALPLVSKDKESLIGGIIKEFQSRWAGILSLPDDARRVHRRSEELQSKVLAAFAAPAPGWAHARHHCPDVMIAADSVEAIKRGNFQLVMGELHVGTNTLTASSFVSQHPAPEDLLRCLESDIPETKALPMPFIEGLTSRTNIGLVSPRDYRIELEREAFTTDRAQALAIADLVVEEWDHKLMIRTRDGSLSFEIIEVFGPILSGLVVDLFKVLSIREHMPRVSIDRLTIARETWNFHPASISWAFLKDENERFLAARRWAEQEQLPSRMFVKVPVEAKPFYLSLESPVYVNILTRMVRRTLESEGEQANVKLVEMVPEVGQAWLPDSKGNRYTSELRFIAFDLAQRNYTPSTQ